MGDILLEYFRAHLPEEIVPLVSDTLLALEAGDYLKVLQHSDVRKLLGHENDDATGPMLSQESEDWTAYVTRRLHAMSSADIGSHSESGDEAPSRGCVLLLVAIAALYAFVQSSTTGPPLSFDSAEVLFSRSITHDGNLVRQRRRNLIESLTRDGVAAYRLTPNVELLSLAYVLLSDSSVMGLRSFTWINLRLRFVHQRLLSEPAPSLQKEIYEDLKHFERILSSERASSDLRDVQSHFLLERAAIHTYYGFDKMARADLEAATAMREFHFALTGILGKRTKFQQTDLSQLVILAKSSEPAGQALEEKNTIKPENLNLNDDTLLESISFAPEAISTDIKASSSLPASLATLDPANQPLLHTLDSVILLSLASSITNTNPADGLMREETLPYAARVLDGGSSNWQVYTQALLVRSRIEGYRSRTMERGLLQLQALVDQVIAQTSGSTTKVDAQPDAATTSFLPRADGIESAPVNERLRYVFALCSPSRWEVEAELAARWVSVGGLRSALEIYERLEMWADAALCWAATEKEDKARRMIRRQLFHATAGNDDEADPELEMWEGGPRDPPPTEAPRLYCILGDLDNDLHMYERAWEISGMHYARAQRSLGQRYFSTLR